MGPVLRRRACGPTQPVGSSPTGTNVQATEVDEPNVAKTDGRLVVRLSGADAGRHRRLRRPPRASCRRTRLPGRTPVQPELLLRGRHVVVLGSEPVLTQGGPVVDGLGPGPVRLRSGPGRRVHSVPGSSGSTSPPRPRRGSSPTRPWTAGWLAARQYADGTVRRGAHHPHPAPVRAARRSPDRAEASRHNRALVRRAPVQAWLPTVRSADGTHRPLLRCDQVRHPVRPSGPGILSVVGFPVRDPARLHATAVTAAGDLAYSSADHVYVATTRSGRTTVHAFDLVGPHDVRRVGVGSRHRPGPLVARRARRPAAGR